MLVSFARIGRAHHRAGGEQPAQRDGLAVPDDAVQHAGGAQRHQPVQQHLPGDDDVVGHHRQDQRTDQPAPVPVQPPAQQVGHGDGAARRSTAGSARAVQSLTSSPQEQRQQHLEQHRMRPEDREDPQHRRVAGDRGGRAGVHRLVAVESDGIELPEPQERRRPRGRRAPATRCEATRRSNARTPLAEGRAPAGHAARPVPALHAHRGHPGSAPSRSCHGRVGLRRTVGHLRRRRALRASNPAASAIRSAQEKSSDAMPRTRTFRIAEARMTFSLRRSSA